ncbi:MAG TPA: hypothetical protein VMB27_07160 [Solirubrobacteraceae bacterium]|nr:hypothetical protein [Solirubrobacteraceae bacterium]
MTTIHFGQTASVTPEQFIAGLADFGPGHAGYTYTFTRGADGRTDVDVLVTREGKSLEDRVLWLVLWTIGRRFLVHEFGNAVRAIEVRSYGANPAIADGPTMGLVC